MRIRFDMEPLEYGPLTVVIVLRVESESRNRIIGIVVDAVYDVYNIPGEQIKPSPDFGSLADTDFITGLASVEEKMIIVLDVDRMLNFRQLAAMDELTD